MTILALDLGTKTGWALLKDGVVTQGTWRLATPKEVTQQKRDGLDRCCDIRFARLQAYLSGLGQIDHCYFEDVQFSVSTGQTQLWAGFRTLVILMHPRVQLKAVPVGTLKKYATGSGNADKDAMKRALVGTVKPEVLEAMDDNAVDAYHLLTMARCDLQT